MAQRSKTQPKQRRRQIQPDTGPELAFGKALREFRATSGISQEQFALEGGFDRTYISLVERGISSPTIRALFKLAEMLRVAPSDIVKRTEELLAIELKAGRKRPPGIAAKGR